MNQLMTDMGQPYWGVDPLEDVEYPDPEENLAEARRALALIEQAKHADTLPRRFERMLEDATLGMTDRDRVIAYQFARFGLNFAIEAQQATLLALKNSQPNLLNGGRR